MIIQFFIAAAITMVQMEPQWTRIGQPAPYLYYHTYTAYQVPSLPFGYNVPSPYIAATVELCFYLNVKGNFSQFIQTKILKKLIFSLISGVMGLYAACDSNVDGALTIDEVLLNPSELCKSGKVGNQSTQELEEHTSYFHSKDTNGDGKLTFYEMVSDMVSNNVCLPSDLKGNE